MSHVAEVDALRAASGAAAVGWGAEVSERVENGADLLVHWLQYLITYQKTGTADELLPATASAIREAAALLALGLVRPALFSFRCQVDLVLSWVFYKDHPMEWALVNDSSEGFKLKKDLFLYFEQHNLGFGNRFKMLVEKKVRLTADPYKLLSAHVHAQSKPVLPKVTHLEDMIRPKDECLECASVSFEVAEYLNDVLLCVYRPAWKALPTKVCSAAVARFGSHSAMAGFVV